MEQRTLTLLDDGASIELVSRSDGQRIYLEPDSLLRSLGWELKPEGLCREGVCIPVANPQDLENPEGLELGTFAALLGRPLTIEPAASVAALGTSAADRGRQLATLEAPDFELPDLDGKLHSLSEYRGKKILLYMHASW